MSRLIFFQAELQPAIARPLVIDLGTADSGSEVKTTTDALAKNQEQQSKFIVAHQTPKVE